MLEINDKALLNKARELDSNIEKEIANWDNPSKLKYYEDNVNSSREELMEIIKENRMGYTVDFLYRNKQGESIISLLTSGYYATAPIGANRVNGIDVDANKDDDWFLFKLARKHCGGYYKIDSPHYLVRNVSCRKVLGDVIDNEYNGEIEIELAEILDVPYDKLVNFMMSNTRNLTNENLEKVVNFLAEYLTPNSTPVLSS